MAGGLDRDFHAEPLEIDDGGEDGQSCEEVHDVGKMLSVEGLAESAGFVWPGDEEMEKRDDCALEFFATAGVDGGGREGLPDNRFADVGGDEEGDSRSKTVALLQQLIEKNDHQASNDQLDNQQEADAGTEIAWLTVQTSEDEDTSLTEGEDDGEELLRSLVQFAVGLEIEVDVDKMSTCKKLGFLSGSMSCS